MNTNTQAVAKVVGYTEENYMSIDITDKYEGYKYYPKPALRHVLYLSFNDKNGIEKYIKATFYMVRDQCSSGYCICDTAKYDIELLHMLPTEYGAYAQPSFGALSVPFDTDKMKFASHDDYGDGQGIINNVLCYSEVGGDGYYPAGFYRIHKELFSDEFYPQDNIYIFTGKIPENIKEITKKENPNVRYVELMTPVDVASLSKLEFDVLVDEKSSTNPKELQEKFPEKKVVVFNFHSKLDRYQRGCNAGMSRYEVSSSDEETEDKEADSKTRDKVYILFGESGSGKSYLAANLLSLTVIETDSCDTLPETLNYDVIVLGNKHKYTLEDIEKRVRAKEVIKLEFSSELNFE